MAYMKKVPTNSNEHSQLGHHVPKVVCESRVQVPTMLLCAKLSFTQKGEQTTDNVEGVSYGIR